MLGHWHPAGRHHNSHCGGNIQRVLAIAAGSADIHRVFGCRNCVHVFAKGRCSNSNGGREVLRLVGEEQPVTGLIRRHVLIEQIHKAEDQLVERELTHTLASGSMPQIRRKLASMAWPCSVAMLSG